MKNSLAWIKVWLFQEQILILSRIPSFLPSSSNCHLKEMLKKKKNSPQQQTQTKTHTQNKRKDFLKKGLIKIAALTVSAVVDSKAWIFF